MEVLFLHVKELSLELLFFFVYHAEVVPHEFINVDVLISGASGGGVVF